MGTLNKSCEHQQEVFQVMNVYNIYVTYMTNYMQKYIWTDILLHLQTKHDIFTNSYNTWPNHYEKQCVKKNVFILSLTSSHSPMS